MKANLLNSFDFMAYDSFEAFSAVLMFKITTFPSPTEKTLISFSGFHKISLKINSTGELILSYIDTSGAEVDQATGKSLTAGSTVYTVVFGFMKNKV